VAAALRVWSHTFSKEFDRLPPHIQQAVQAKIDELGRRLKTFPHHRLTGRGECRLRVGDYRVLYEFDMAAERINLLYVGNRREIYKK
jgi:mRNA interferase RelE/StbE